MGSVWPKDWYDLGPTGSTRNWPSNGAAGDPFHSGSIAAVRKLLPTGNSPSHCKVDLAHTYAIAGFGKDELASTLVFLSVRVGAFGPGNIWKKLEAAFESFQTWCVQRRETTTIKSFCKEELKITSSLGYSIDNIVGL